MAQGGVEGRVLAAVGPPRKVLVRQGVVSVVQLPARARLVTLWDRHTNTTLTTCSRDWRRERLSTANRYCVTVSVIFTDARILRQILTDYEYILR